MNSARAETGSDAPAELSPLKRALLAIEDMRARVAAAEGAAHEPIAIVGMACRFPGGANDPDEFWSMLANGVDAIGEVPADRWDMTELYDPDPGMPGRIVSRAGGFVEGIDQFDPQFFGISPREAITMDPQQRVLLEVSWEALERSGIAPASLAGTRTGVYVGCSINDYGHVTREAMETGALTVDAYVGTGNSDSVNAGRVAFALGLNGPTMSVDTACSSSLVSVHLACQGLRAGEADVAIAGGVSLILTPGVHIYMSQLGALSPSGRCRTFDASADGYVRSEGAAMIVLKRLSDAQAAGDNILAVIRGSAVNHDGRSAGLTVPNGASQQAVIRAALQNAKVDPTEVEFVETHGTGTPLGDPIEVRALDVVYGPGRTEPLRIGSVKTNIGHLESASGIAGLVKLVLALQHETIPPHLHLTDPTPHLAWDELSIEVPTESRPWPRGERTRVAGVNSFGLSGTNSHIVISDPPAPVAASPAGSADRAVQTLTLSARSAASLRDLASATATALTAPGAPSLADAAFTLNTGRNTFGHRLAVAAADGAEAAAALGAFAADGASPTLVARDLGLVPTSKLAFLFTGQGSQYAGMGAELYAAEPVFRGAIDRCDALLREHLDLPLLAVLHGTSASPNAIDDTTYTQPALFALEYALAELWSSWGVRPEMMLGHSIGSFVAAHLAGVMSLEDALVLVATRGRLMGSLPAGGGMASVFAAEPAVAEVVAEVGGKLSIAAINGPDNTVISGPKESLAAALEVFGARGVESRSLTTSHAFHSELMEPILAEFGAVASAVAMRPPQRRRMVSDLTGAIAGDEVATSAYWVEHLRRAVRFADGMAALHAEGCNVFLEVGPAPVLSAMGRRCLPSAPVAWAASMQRDRSDVARIALAAGELWTAGISIDWAARDASFARRRVEMPTARFQRQRYWVPDYDTRVTNKALVVGHPLFGAEAVSAAGPAQFESGINDHRPPFLADRVVHGRVEIGATVFAETAIAAAAHLWGEGAGVEVRGLEAGAPITIDDTPRIYSAVIDRRSREVAGVTAKLGTLDGSWWELVGSATITRLTVDELVSAVPPVLRPPTVEGDDPTALYDAWRQGGLSFGPRAACIDAIWRTPTAATLRVSLPFGSDRFMLYPPLLEVCALALVGDERPRALRRIERIRVVGDTVPEWCVRVLGDADDDTIWFFDGDGQVVASASGFTFRELAAEATPMPRQWVYDLTWRAAGDEPFAEGSRPVHDGSWLLVGAGARIDALSEALAERGTPVVRLDAADLDGDAAAARDVVEHALDADVAPSHILYVPASADGELVSDVTVAETERLLHLVRVVSEAAWARRVASPPRLWLLSRGAMAVDGDLVDVAALPGGALWGFVRTVGTELPAFYGGMVDLDPADDDPAAIVALVAGSGDETWLARRGGQTFVARLRGDASRPAAAGIGTDGAQLITGGFGALGLATARALVERGARRIILVGRSALPARREWQHLAADDPGRARVDAIRELEALGATVHVGAFDVADAAALDAFLDRYEAEGWPPIRGVFHAAGVLRDRSIGDMTDEDVAAALAPKVHGTWNLHTTFGATRPLDHFVLFSSAAGLLGSPGQANYASANAFMDALAHVRRSHGLHGLSVNWGAWAAGMAARDDLEALRERQGQLSIAVDAGMTLMFDLIDADATQALVMPMTTSQLSIAAAVPLMSELVDTVAEAAAPADRRDHGAEILGAPEAQRLTMVLQLLRVRIGGVLGLDADAVDPQSELVSLGLDSIMIVEMTTRLSFELGIGLNPREIFQEPSVQSLAATLLAAIETRPAADGSDGGEPAGTGSVLVVGGPATGMQHVRATLAAAAPAAVDAVTEAPSVATFASPVVVVSEQLATEPAELDALADALPGLRIVHLVRHPFAVIAELAGQLDQRDAESAWHTANGNLLDLAERLGEDRLRVVRIEDLAAADDPVDALLAVIGVVREDGGDVDVLPWAVDAHGPVPSRAPGRGVRQIAEELGYDTTWPEALTVAALESR